MSAMRCALLLALFVANSLLGTAPAAAGEPLRLAQIAPSETELRIYAGLHAAAAEGDAAAIARLIAAGEKPNIQDSRSRTPLHVATFFAQHDAARALIRLGANVNARERQRFDALTIAAAAGDLEMVDMLLAAGADPRAIVGPYDSTALIEAAHLARVDVAERLIAARAPLDHFNALGFTALIEAIVLGNGGAGHAAVVTALARAGADVNLTDRQGMTALAHAEARGYRDMARVLAATEPRPTRMP
jgi:uncharacterized protein